MAGAPGRAPLASRFFADTTPLRASRDFRLLSLGQAVSVLGRQLTVVASPIQVFQLTGSTFMVGLLGLAQFPALLAGSFVGGVLADTRDRRKVLLVAQSLLSLTTVALGVNAMVGAPSTAAVFVFTSANAFLSGIDNPARRAALPRLVGADELAAALALTILLSQTTVAVGPAIAGIVIARWGLAAAYWFDTVTFIVAIVTVILIRPLPPPPDSGRAGFRSIVEGLRFVRSRQELKGVFIIDVNAMVFGMPRALFPELGLEVFHGTEATVGYLFAAPGVGAIVAALTSGWVRDVRRLGKATTVAVLVWGLGITGFGLSPWLWPALGGLAVAGAGDALSAVFRTTMLQLTAPDRLRGRLSAVQVAVVSGGPRLGDAEAGAVAAGFGPRVAAWSGGLASALGALVIARALPGFRNWDGRAYGAQSEVAESGDADAGLPDP